jgi:hypothetical protein
MLLPACSKDITLLAYSLLFKTTEELVPPAEL